jgi:preprotein translocase subunit SecB
MDEMGRHDAKSWSGCWEPRIHATPQPRETFFTMADGKGSGNGNGSQADTAPSINALVQYTKDFSFENPNAPRSLGPQEKPPNIAIQVNVNARQVAEADFEVNILLEGSAGEGAGLLFKFELDYAGLFRLRNIAPNDMHPVVMIECPRLLFPFARQIIADAVRAGGFPPLYIDPIDFAALYRKRLSEATAKVPTSAS